MEKPRVKIRRIVGGLKESMDGIFELENREELLKYLKDNFEFFEPNEGNVTSRPYCYDDRIGWDTHMICINDIPILFSDGPI